MTKKRPDHGLDFSQNALRVVMEATGEKPDARRAAKLKLLRAGAKRRAKKGGK